ncbi:hypothetical protein [Bradyrhizobium sp. NBAIM02]|uniref:hypothetical protein n=1 Tax=Bradyrhizobium sp. NBAIM02 TaxID=2793817 RepID=UPI001CD50D70|nr:hypothetical protein [Bradyrhizobium sp. NBAIM02]MCA1508644.1 hypothetical protein [Bradyrhizobium sp. NBAIM02]
MEQQIGGWMTGADWASEREINIGARAAPWLAETGCRFSPPEVPKLIQKSLERHSSFDIQLAYQELEGHHGTGNGTF